jgi:hypothetical protein
MQFENKKYLFRGMDGHAGFRRNQLYETEVATTDPVEGEPAGIVVITPVSRDFAYHSKEEFNQLWEKK